MNARSAFALVALTSTLFALNLPQAAAQTCRWDGTGPFCDGACSGGESEVTRAATSPGSPPAYNGPVFGSACATGTKAFCCSSPGRTCRWDGTAPFCDGSCRGDETQAEPPAGSSPGRQCVTGSKVYCCHSNVATGSTHAPLQVAPQFTRYAAFWDKSSGPAWQARHGLNSAQYQQAFDTLAQQGYRLVEISGYGVGNNDMYVAIWEQRSGPAWVARHGLNSAQYQQAFDTFVQQGYRLIDVSGYTVGGQDRYAAIWEKSQGPAWQARHGLTSAQYQQEFNTLTQQGYRLVDVSGYEVGGQDHYAAIWEKSEAPAWQARHGMTSAQYQQEFNTLSQQGYRLIHIRGWPSGNTVHYAAIWEKTDGSPWIARHGMLSNDYQEEFDTLLKQGYRLKHVSGYHVFN
jgi:DNA-binding transcriptional regulator of glucitol operon